MILSLFLTHTHTQSTHTHKAHTHKPSKNGPKEEWALVKVSVTSKYNGTDFCKHGGGGGGGGGRGVVFALFLRGMVHHLNSLLSEVPLYLLQV